ncbi:hypothetical protein [Ancylobacter defluvii]|uniref:Uncharacterized protein n=1 Tax=Ancylobacter defluvii TaxID=1282440 RepID=A0A9W6K1E0_9HYPH|nr:hypothetical protein [Ancylobacter defluvii]MBS7586433.1 hypothetical protein [Ancylobacter defluvii]GLK85714.1 hypothetical protein GCM10017653_37840 [Ancylobacter defluvii]
MTKLIDRQRAAKLTNAMVNALDLLATRGSAMRYRVGWGFGSMAGPIIPPITMDALAARGLVRTRHSGADLTKEGRRTHAELRAAA